MAGNQSLRLVLQRTDSTCPLSRTSNQFPKKFSVVRAFRGEELRSDVSSGRAHVQQSSLQNKAYRSYAIFIEKPCITRLLQTSAQTRDENAAISSNARLATSAEREVPRATCNERGARSSPRSLQRARSAKFPARLATSAEREVPRATCNERGARSSPRDLQRARSAKFPARLATSAEREVPRATCNEREARSSPRRNRSVSPIKEKRFSVFRLRTLTTAIFQTALFIIHPL